MQNNFPLVTSTWLAQQCKNKNIVILESSVQFSAEQLCIPSARRFDFKKVFCNNSSNLPGMMPSTKKFNTEARKLGINKDSVIVVYDNKGIFSAPRAWWMFKSMGHKQVFVLDGGLPKWIKENRTIDKILDKNVQIGNFDGQIESINIKNAEDILNLHLNDNIQIIDARSAGRFKGIEPEPRAGLRLGHIPNSINIPFTSLLKDGEYIEVEKLQSIFSNAAIDKNKIQIFTCGSGVTACVVLLAAKIAGYHCMHVYDGSWTEWGANPLFPVT